MLDIGFFELLVVGVVLIIVMGPERLPEVAKQAAFFIRKARQGMFRLRNEMQHEMDGTPFADLQQAKQEMVDLKNDIRQFGSELADAADQQISKDEVDQELLEDTDTHDDTKGHIKKTAKTAQTPENKSAEEL